MSARDVVKALKLGKEDSSVPDGLKVAELEVRKLLLIGAGICEPGERDARAAIDAAINAVAREMWGSTSRARLPAHVMPRSSSASRSANW